MKKTNACLTQVYQWQNNEICTLIMVIWNTKKKLSQIPKPHKLMVEEENVYVWKKRVYDYTFLKFHKHLRFAKAIIPFER